MGKITDRNFFTQSAELLAPKLIGKMICRKMEDGFIIKYRITATEAYCDDDNACDKAESQKLLGGHLYITKKGMHGYCRFDVVANTEDKAEGVLISGIDCYNGPGLAADALDINEALDGEDLLISETIWLEDDGVESELKPATERNIGVTHDEVTRKKKQRFAVKRFMFSLVIACTVLISSSLSGYYSNPVYARESAHGNSFNSKLVIDGSSYWVAVLESFYVNGKKIKVTSVSRADDYDSYLKINTTSGITYLVKGSDDTSVEVIYTAKYANKKVIIPRTLSVKIIAAEYAMRPDAPINDGETYTYLNHKIVYDVTYHLKSPKIKSVKFSGKNNKSRHFNKLAIHSSCKALKSFKLTKDTHYVENMSPKTKITIAKNAFSDTCIRSVTKIRKKDCANKKWWKEAFYTKSGKYHQYNVYG